MDAVVFIMLQIFFATWAIWKIFPSFSWGVFGHVTYLDQLRAREKNFLDYKSHYTSKFWGINKIYFVLDLDINFRGIFDKMILLSLAS